MEAGSYVSHHILGLCKVKRWETKTIGSSSKDFLVIGQVNGTATALVAVERAITDLRKLTPAYEIETLVEDVKGPIYVDDTTWNSRYRKFTEELSEGTFKAWLTVAVKLMSQRHERDISFGERKMLDTCIDNMAGELAVQTKQTLDAATEYLRSNLTARVGSA